MYLKKFKLGEHGKMAAGNQSKTLCFLLLFHKKNWVGREMGKVKHFMGMSSNRMKHTNVGKEYYHELYLVRVISFQTKIK